MILAEAADAAPVMASSSSTSYNMGDMSYAEFTAYRQKRNTDYISKLWRQQRDLINRELLLTQKAQQDSLLTKNSIFPHIKPLDVMSHSTSEKRQMFQSRVRPAFNRGKTVVLAVDPERHIQLEKERMAQQEQRNRPKSPIQLIPIDVKPLGAPTPKPTTVAISSTHRHANKSQSNAEILSKSLPNNLTSSLELWKKPAPLLSKKLSGGNQAGFTAGDTASTVLESLAITMKTCQNIHTMNNLAKYTIEESQNPQKPESHGVLDAMIARKTLKPRKPMTGFGSYGTKLPPAAASNLDLYLKASSVNQTLEEDPLEAVWKAQSSQNSCCDNDDEDCSICGKYSSKLPIIPFISTRPYTNMPTNSRQTMRSTDTTLPPEDCARKTLVIELPNINYTPATPPKLIIPQPASHKFRAHKVISLQKILKQKELRQRELTNLFSDITELSHVNHVLSSYAVKNS